MHDTAYIMGGLFFSNYVTKRKCKILELGSQNVNGSLRDFSKKNWKYVGADMVEGEGVDIVVDIGKPLPFEDKSFDYIVTSSVFEHDQFFWETFLELVRLTKIGGYIYINAPSNGTFHRFPVDNWRFYPDSGIALQNWARKKGFDVTLIESFIGLRKNDVWNDFCAIFAVGSAEIPKTGFIHELIPCENILKINETEVVNLKNETEDMRLIEENSISSSPEIQSLKRQINWLKIENKLLRTKCVMRDFDIGNADTKSDGLDSFAQIGSFNWFGDIDGAKWSSKLGGYSLSFGSDNTENLDSLNNDNFTVCGRRYSVKIRFNSLGQIEVLGGIIVNGNLIANKNGNLNLQIYNEQNMPLNGSKGEIIAIKQADNTYKLSIFDGDDWCCFERDKLKI